MNTQRAADVLRRQPRAEHSHMAAQIITLTMPLGHVITLLLATFHATGRYAENGFRPDQYADLTEVKDALVTVFAKALSTARTEATQ